MRYIILAAGKGTRLHPITLSAAKSLYRLDENTTVIQRMVRLIKTYDEEALITVVTGFMREDIVSQLSDENITFVDNPYYSVTNSVASLWFARQELMKDEPVTIFNADVVVDDDLVRDIITKPPTKATVLIDTSIQNDGDYNARVIDDKVVVMSNNLSTYDGEYVGITRLDAASAKMFCREVECFVAHERYNDWYETALIQMVFEDGFDLYYHDVADYQWTEVDCVDDLFFAMHIHRKSAI